MAKSDTNLDPRPAVNEPKPILIILAVVAVLALWAGNWIYGAFLKETERGIFGDTFGAVNALFSGLAFAGVTYAILMQRYEISLAKEDARVTKKILDDQTDHLDRQNKRERAKSSEETFFKLLSMLQEVSETVFFTKKYNGAPIITKGRQALSDIAEKIYPTAHLSGPRSLENYDAAIDRFMKDYGSNISHYLRSFEALLTYVTVTQDIDREFYAEILLGQISEAEQKILFHCGLHPKFARLKSLVERYHVLTGMNLDDAFFQKLVSSYALSAFHFTSSHIEDSLNVGWRGMPKDE